MESSLPSDIQQRIEAQLAAGGFANEHDVLREALVGLERRQHGLARLREMVAAAEEDVAAQRVGKFDRHAIKQEVRSRLSQLGIDE